MSEALREPTLSFVDLRVRPVREPLRERSRGQRVLQLWTGLGDVAIIAVATGLAAIGRTHLGWFQDGNVIAGEPWKVAGWILVVWLLANVWVGTYRRSVLGVGTHEYARVVWAAAATAGVIGIGCYLSKYPLSRALFVLVFAVGVPLLLVWRHTSRRLARIAHTRGRMLTRVLLSGDERHVDEVARVLRRKDWLGHQIVGALVSDAGQQRQTPGGVPVVGDLHETAELVDEHRADLVVFAEGSFATPADFRRTAWRLEGKDVEMVVVPSLSDISAGRMTMRPVGGLPLVHVGQPQALAASRGAKRTFDIVGALLALLLAAPVMIAVALAIRWEDKGPVLFRQVRVGRDGQLFECLKFRSMVVDAEARLAGVSHLNKNADGVLFKMAEDPRVTRVGRLIRRFSLDELPQLFNVLRGDMSLVGPRPALPAEVSRYHDDVTRRLHVRPGLTGLWQVSGRSDLPWEDAVRLDLYYVDNWSIVQDLTILMRTVQAVVAPRGAY